MHLQNLKMQNVQGRQQQKAPFPQLGSSWLPLGTAASGRLWLGGFVTAALWSQLQQGDSCVGPGGKWSAALAARAQEALEEACHTATRGAPRPPRCAHQTGTERGPRPLLGAGAFMEGPSPPAWAGSAHRQEGGHSATQGTILTPPHGPTSHTASSCTGKAPVEGGVSCTALSC